MNFTGFTQEQFEVFGIPTFAERMAGIRALVRPALLALGEDLAGPFSALAGHALYPRVALHARRTVNPPDDTWVAFGRSAKGYKAFAHLAVGIQEEGIYVGLVLKDEAEDDRASLGRQITADPSWTLDLCRKLKGYRLEEWKDRDLSTFGEEDLCKLGDTLVNRKTASLHLVKGIPRRDKRLADPAEVILLAQKMVKPLMPSYGWSCVGKLG